MTVPMTKAPAAPARTLATLSPGARAVVRAIVAETSLQVRLLELGFTPGTPIRVVRTAPFGDPIELVVRDSHFSIRRSEARWIDVEIL